MSLEDKLKIIEDSYGGYWRYDFTDFSYLYNPYFPPKEFYSKLSQALPKLIGNYPSSHKRLSKLLSDWYNDEGFVPDNLIVGNGSSEFIRILNKNFVKKVTIPVPTFNEYENGLTKEQINYFVLSADKEFVLDKKAFVKSVKDSKSNVAVIINPNNPTGNVLSAKDIIWILQQLDSITLIVDESFIDLTDAKGIYSVQNMVNRYPSLVIIRSFSKELSVPGIRLGYLLTANKVIKDVIMAHLPIWNINSLAEYFVENFGNYRESYKRSIKTLLEARQKLYENLKGIAFLKVFPSYANFFICRVDGSAERLQRKLLDDFKILIKNCSSKKSLEGKNYVRIAVKAGEDNARLITILKSLEGEI